MAVLGNSLKDIVKVNVVMLPVFQQKKIFFGFVIAAFTMFIVGCWKQVAFTQHLVYHVFCQQPIFIQPDQGIFVRLVKKLEKGSKLLGQN